MQQNCKLDRPSNASRIRRTNASKLPNVFVVFETSKIRQLRSPLKRKSEKWQGACIDNGAQKTVIGLKQALAYCSFVGVPFNPRKNRNIYRFGVDERESLGSIEIRIPLPGFAFIPIQVDVIPTNIPFLLGLDTLDKCKMYFDNTTNKLVWPKGNWEHPVVRKLGHAYVEWKPSDQILFTRAELLRLHREFQHPSDDKLLSFLKKARPSEFNGETRKILEEISSACNTCQRLGPKPLRFKGTLSSGEELIFGEELSIDLMFIDSEAILHIVDTATRFSAAVFLREYGQSVEGIWLAFIEVWRTMYAGYPNRLRADAGSAFTWLRWKSITDFVGITLRISGVESHNSLGVGERYHARLRRFYRKVKLEFPQLSKDIILRLAVKAMNDTMGENGLVPSLLVFGIIPRFPIINSELPTQKERMEALASAQMEMNSIIAERRISAALQRNIPRSAGQVLEVGDEVLVYRENPDV